MASGKKQAKKLEEECWHSNHTQGEGLLYLASQTRLWKVGDMYKQPARSRYLACHKKGQSDAYWLMCWTGQGDLRFKSTHSRKNLF